MKAPQIRIEVQDVTGQLWRFDTRDADLVGPWLVALWRDEPSLTTTHRQTHIAVFRE